MNHKLRNTIYTLLIVASSCIIIYFSIKNKKSGDIVPDRTYFNPILPGFYPDPSICKAGNDFYIVTSTFAYYPGIPVFHSRDLINWRQIGHVLDRPEQLDLDGLGISRGIFASAISYHDGTFYVVSTLVDGGENFIVTSDKPEGPWSDPIWFPEIEGIDPSLFFDDNGRSYIVFNSEPPEGKSLYEGHRAIWMLEFDACAKKTIGKQHLLINGGTDIRKKTIWIEAPHIFKENGYYYLIAAEGGTGINHSEVVFRSGDVKGPYISYDKNPILTQRHLDISRPFPVTCTGHADMVQAGDSSWWAVFLGCSPYDSNYFNTGRETFLAPVKWTTDDWPVINPGFETVQYSYHGPELKTFTFDDKILNGNFKVRDEFDEEELDFSWIFIRTLREKWYSLAESQGKLRIYLRPEVIWGKNNPSYVGRRQQHSFCDVSTAISFNPESENENSGLIAFHNETNFYYIGKTFKKNRAVIHLIKGKNVQSTHINGFKENRTEIMAGKILENSETNKELYLKIEISGDKYSFFYSVVRGEWTTLFEGADGKYLSTEVAHGFVGTTLGMYASSNGKDSENFADFSWFEYAGHDPVYNNIK